MLAEPSALVPLHLAGVFDFTKMDLEFVKFNTFMVDFKQRFMASKQQVEDLCKQKTEMQQARVDATHKTKELEEARAALAAAERIRSSDVVVQNYIQYMRSEIHSMKSLIQKMEEHIAAQNERSLQLEKEYDKATKDAQTCIDRAHMMMRM